MSMTAHPTLVQYPLAVGTVERKRRYVDFEPLAALAHHLVAAGHESRRGRQRHAAGIFEVLAWLEHRLLADHAFAADFLLATRGVGDDPVSRPQLNRLLAGIGDDDGVGPEELTPVGGRALGEEIRFDGDLDSAGNGAVHADRLSQNVRASYRKVPVEPIARPAPGAPVVVFFNRRFNIVR